jgi:hypothetical protein
VRQIDDLLVDQEAAPRTIRRIISTAKRNSQPQPSPLRLCKYIFVAKKR